MLLAVTLTISLLTGFGISQNVNAQRSSGAASGNGTDTYAITGARIVTLAGEVIPRGTIVVRNGLIAAVGANTPAPADARQIDGTGLTVYPGLIDALTSIGVGAAPAQTGGATSPAPGVINIVAAQSTGFSSPNSTQPPGLQPEILAADFVRIGGEAFDQARNAGITAALTAPREGIFIGRSAFISLAGETPQSIVVRSPVALHVGFTPLRTGEYPASLLGVHAAIRQSLFDARRYREANEVYARNPRGLRRPEQDKSLEALQPVLRGELPVVMNANTEREITRALDLAQEFSLRAIIAGGAESFRVAERLKRQNVPVLLSLNFPRRTTAPAADADPEPLRLLRNRAQAPKTAADLQRAGVSFAFQSGALTNMSDFLTNAAKSVENGLPADEALRAMTVRPAELFGVADRLGTIETGKIANLTVTRGDIFARDRQITHVFIDGRPVDLKPVTSTVSPASGASGTYRLLLKIGELPETSITLSLREESGNLGGAISGELGSGTISNASLSATGELRFNVPVTFQGQTSDAVFSGTLSGNQMRGNVQIPNRDDGTFTGSRTGAPPTPNGGNPGTTPATTPGTTTPGTTQPSQTPATPPSAQSTTSIDLTGTWSVTVDAGGQQIPATLQLQQQGATLTGSIQSQLGGGEISGGSVNAEGFSFSTVVTISGRTIDLEFRGTANGNRISGSVTTPQGPANFTGTRPGRSE